MAQATWEKGASAEALRVARKPGDRRKFFLGGLLILAAIIYLIVSGTMAGAQYYMTVDDLLKNPEYVGQTVRISGVVLGDTIEYDSQNLLIDFTIANLPSQYDDLAAALHQAANTPGASRLPVHVENQVMPDLLQHEAQAILTGKLGEDGVFYASELLLKCPSRFVESGPNGEMLEAGA